jgi:hypothetical protein
LNAAAAKGRWPPETRTDLEREIVIKADRNFFWVRLISDLTSQKRTTTKEYFEQVIEESLSDLDGLYCSILADIENPPLAAKILRLLVGSVRLLTTAEIQVALAIDLDHETLRSLEEGGDTAVESTI